MRSTVFALLFPVAVVAVSISGCGGSSDNSSISGSGTDTSSTDTSGSDTSGSGVSSGVPSGGTAALQLGPASRGAWTWVGGSDVPDRPATYGVKGVANAANIPGARGGANRWIDRNGNLWLFGGYGVDASGVKGYLNDLWKFDGTSWTWVSGSSSINSLGSYGTKGVAAASNEPSARDCGSTWTDAAGNLWLFGGVVRENDSTKYLNDLWKFDGSKWTWISGSDLPGSPTVYGVTGVPSPLNVPGAREGAISWVDRSDRLWLFGGSGKDAAGVRGHLNEIWRYDGANWTFISGTTIAEDVAVFGVQGVASPINKPLGRDLIYPWTDSDGNLWLFGGCSNVGYWSDLWKFDGSTWTWVSGNTTPNSRGVYDIRGIASPMAKPGGRAGYISWMDKNGAMWLYGGYGTDGRYNGQLSDLWKFDGASWTLVAGDETSNLSPFYGTKGTASSLNTPARIFGSASWVVNGKVWVFGGYVDGGMTNAMWKYEP